MSVGTNERTALIGGPRASPVLSVMVSGFGLSGFGYNIIVMNMVMGLIHGLTPAKEGMLTSLFVVGMLLGQIGFATFIDVGGMRLASVLACTLAVFGALLSGSASWLVPDVPLFEMLAVGRLLCGIGCGAEFPLSAALTKSMKTIALTNRQQFVANIAMVKLGMVLCPTLMLGVIPMELPSGRTWQIVFACGALPSLACLAVRLIALPMSGIVFDYELAPESQHGQQVQAPSGFISKLTKAANWEYLAAVSAWVLTGAAASSTACYSSWTFDTAMHVEKHHPQLLGKTWYGFSNHLCAFAAALIANLVIKRTSLRTTGTWAPIAFSMFLFATALLGQSFPALVSLDLAMVCDGLCVSIAYTWVAELYSANVVATLIGFAAACAKVSQSCVLAVTPIIADRYGISVVHIFNGSMLLVAGMLTAWCCSTDAARESLSKEKLAGLTDSNP